MAGDVTITGNAALTDVSALEGLVIGGDLEITNNAALPQCQATLLASRLVNAIGGAITVTGNDTAAACP